MNGGTMSRLDRGLVVVAVLLALAVVGVLIYAIPILSNR